MSDRQSDIRENRGGKGKRERDKVADQEDDDEEDMKDRDGYEERCCINILLILTVFSLPLSPQSQLSFSRLLARGIEPLRPLKATFLQAKSD